MPWRLSEQKKSFGDGYFAVGTVPRRFFAGIMAIAMFLLLLLLVLSLVPPCILLFPEVPIDYLRLVDRESTARWCRPPGIPLGLGMLSGDTWAWYLRSAVVATCVWSREVAL